MPTQRDSRDRSRGQIEGLPLLKNREVLSADKGALLGWKAALASLLVGATAATIAASLADHLKAELRFVPSEERVMEGTGVRSACDLTESPVSR